MACLQEMLQSNPIRQCTKSSIPFANNHDAEIPYTNLQITFAGSRVDEVKEGRPTTVATVFSTLLFAPGAAADTCSAAACIHARGSRKQGLCVIYDKRMLTYARIAKAETGKLSCTHITRSICSSR